MNRYRKSWLRALMLLPLLLTASKAQTYQGAFDVANCAQIYGWATTSPVDIYDGTVKIATVAANQWRPDLNANVGFSFPTPASLKDNQLHSLSAKYGGTNIPLVNSPQPLQCTVSASGYPYYYVSTLTNFTGWQQNGSVVPSSYGLTAQGSGGALISPTLAPDGTAEYEVRTTLRLKSSGGTYVQYLRASQNAAPGQGTYYSVELQNPTFSASGCSAVLAFNQTTNGSVMWLGSTVVACYDGMEIRTVVGPDFQFTLVNGTVYPVFASLPSGSPGIGASNTPSGNSISLVMLGPKDRTPPGGVLSFTINSSILPNSVTLRWQGAVDDPNGVGVHFYHVYRNGVLIQTTRTPEFTDTTLSPNTGYNYAISPLDLHANQGPGTTVTVATPSAGAVDPRRVGVRPSGAYWGAGGEQIDTLTGNLNFSLPLLHAQGRGGWSVPFTLSYNSQNWRWDPGGCWLLGSDIGYGFGWRLQAGSLTPFWPTITPSIITCLRTVRERSIASVSTPMGCGRREKAFMFGMTPMPTGCTSGMAAFG